MTVDEVLHRLSDAQRSLDNLETQLQVMELAAEAKEAKLSISIEIDWLGLIEVTRLQLAQIPKPLEDVEVFLREIWSRERKAKKAAGGDNGQGGTK